MSVIYKFQIVREGFRNRDVFPIYRDNLAIDFEKESGQAFFRRKLSGKLTFAGEDFAFIDECAFDTEFKVVILTSWDMGGTWLKYWQGSFWKTDCEFDFDARTVSVMPTVKDNYTDVLAGLEKEYNLIDLAPEIFELTMDKRPAVQIYEAGDDTIGCFLGNIWWEQDCNAVNDPHAYYFASIPAYRIITLSGDGVPDDVNDALWEQAPTGPSAGNDDFTLIWANENRHVEVWRKISGIVVATWELQEIEPGVPVPDYYELIYGVEYTLACTWYSSSIPNPGDLQLIMMPLTLWSRILLDTRTIGGQSATRLREDDMCGNNRNYHYAFAKALTDNIAISSELSDEPTPWGLYKPGKYYVTPSEPGLWYPVAKSAWGRVSIWFKPIAEDISARAPQRSRVNFPIASVIARLLQQFAPGIVHEETTAYSEFLYGENPLTGESPLRLAITPKSNILVGDYDQPAQKAPITLKWVFDMLRDCFRCYWFIETDGSLRIEHISWFMRGKDYRGDMQVGRDLTNEIVARTGKPWASGMNKYTFRKPDMYGRYEFSWMDDVTQLFEGYPIDIISRFVNPGSTEKVAVSNFTSDVDYMMINPEAVSNDGFALLAARESGGTYYLPYIEVTDNGSSFILQNGYLSFAFLQIYYAYDMVAPQYSINGVVKIALGMKRMREQQITFPCEVDPDVMELIKTGLGAGEIEKLSINLSSRSGKATLALKTE